MRDRVMYGEYGVLQRLVTLKRVNLQSHFQRSISVKRPAVALKLAVVRKLLRDRTCPCFTILGTLSIAFGALALRAQDPAPLRQPDVIPYQLAAALMSAGPVGADPQILVAAMPEWVSSKLVMPRDAHVLGSAYIGTSAVVILALPPTADSVIPEMRRALLDKGWKAPPPPPNGSGGFRPAPSPGADSRRLTLCSDQQMMTASSALRRGMVTEVTVRLSAVSPTGYSTCKPVVPQYMSGSNMRPSFPTLYQPVGISDINPMMGDCLNPRYNINSTAANIRTAITPDALLDHYARQLQDSGWKPVDNHETVTSRSWTRPDSTGAPVKATLNVLTYGNATPACTEVTLVIAPQRKP